MQPEKNLLEFGEEMTWRDWLRAVGVAVLVLPFVWLLFVLLLS